MKKKWRICESCGYYFPEYRLLGFLWWKNPGSEYEVYFPTLQKARDYIHEIDTGDTPATWTVVEYLRHPDRGDG